MVCHHGMKNPPPPRDTGGLLRPQPTGQLFEPTRPKKHSSRTAKKKRERPARPQDLRSPRSVNAFSTRPWTGRCRPEEHYTEPEAKGKPDRKSTRLNSSHVSISYAVFCLK